MSLNTPSRGPPRGVCLPGEAGGQQTGGAARAGVPGQQGGVVRN